MIFIYLQQFKIELVRYFLYFLSFLNTAQRDSEEDF
jgi:hypothetical protein